VNKRKEGIKKYAMLVEKTERRAVKVTKRKITQGIASIPCTSPCFVVCDLGGTERGGGTREIKTQTMTRHESLNIGHIGHTTPVANLSTIDEALSWVVLVCSTKVVFTVLYTLMMNYHI
jgi:hypothetical protein